MIRRREWLQLAAMGSAGLTSACVGGQTEDENPPEDTSVQPNVLFIAVDDLNDWVGFLKGHPQVITPNMDALASCSMVFQRAYCSAPLCSPSRAGALSGLSVASSGVYDNKATFHSVNGAGKRVVDQIFAGNGYVVQRYGKIDHLYGGEIKQPLPEPQPEKPYANKACPLQKGGGAFDWGPAPGAESDQPDYQYAQKGIDFINKRSVKDAPFFLAVGFVRTHMGWWVPQKYIDMYPPSNEIVLPFVPPDDLADVGPVAKKIASDLNVHNCVVKNSLWGDAVRAYLSSITSVDVQVGRLITALNNSPHAQNTIVVLWSDHGFHLGEKFHWFKQALWEPCTRVPFLIKLPGQELTQTFSQPVSLLDMAPTLLDLASITPDYPMDGRSLKPLMKNPTLTWDKPVLTTVAASYTAEDKPNFAYSVRDTQWRYIRYSSSEMELYDETTDGVERYNLAFDLESRTKYADVISRLSAFMPPLPV